MTPVLRGVVALAAGAALGAVLHQSPVAAVLHAAAELAVRARAGVRVPDGVLRPGHGDAFAGKPRRAARPRNAARGAGCRTLSLASLGVLSVLAASPDRIPIIVVHRAAVSVPSFVQHLQQALPTNLFAALAR